jgi:hypothetical protein
MIVAALVFSGCQVVVFACFIIATRFWFESEKRKAIRELTEFARSMIEAPDENTPSPLAALIDQGALLLAARLMQQIKAMLAGVESGEAKAEQGRLFGEASAASPLLGIVGAMLPKRIRNGLMRNPQMMAALSRLGGGNHTGGPEAAIPPRRHRD